MLSECRLTRRGGNHHGLKQAHDVLTAQRRTVTVREAVPGDGVSAIEACVRKLAAFASIAHRLDVVRATAGFVLGAARQRQFEGFTIGFYR